MSMIIDGLGVRGRDTVPWHLHSCDMVLHVFAHFFVRDTLRYVMGFRVVRSLEMFYVPGLPHAENKGDQAMKRSSYLASQIEQGSICSIMEYHG